MNIFKVISGLSICVALTGCASPDGGRGVCGIRNSRYISQADNIGVGAQPSMDDFTALLAYGITNVVCYNHKSEKVPEGMTVHCFYISTWRQIAGGPKLQALFVDSIDCITPGTFIHCTHGANRSGSMYIIMMEHYGYPRGQAIALADKYGWNTSFRGLKKFVYDFK